MTIWVVDRDQRRISNLIPNNNNNYISVISLIEYNHFKNCILKIVKYKQSKQKTKGRQTDRQRKEWWKPGRLHSWTSTIFSSRLHCLVKVGISCANHHIFQSCHHCLTRNIKLTQMVHHSICHWAHRESIWLHTDWASALWQQYCLWY